MNILTHMSQFNSVIALYHRSVSVQTCISSGWRGWGSIARWWGVLRLLRGHEELPVQEPCDYGQ